ncbi:MAG: SDR family oxidoreductase [Candidatus Promineifilaceae bacterium]|nr:SDR family oxidoreductase [Candidatus Promineifilaceae bacterium]
MNKKPLKTGAVVAGIALGYLGTRLWRKQGEAPAERIFENKVAVVTGGASGIGRALCEALSARGAVVIVGDIHGEGAAEVAAAIRANGGRAEGGFLDVTDPDGVEGLVDRVIDHHGRLDYMFNNAGIGISGSLEDVTLADWQAVINVNLWGVIFGTRAAHKQMQRQGYGHIVNTASLLGLIPAPTAIPYAVTKHGVVGLSTSLRDAAAREGVKVSVVCPGYIETPIWQTTKYVTEDREKVLARLKHVPKASPAECAETILQGVAENKGIIPVTGLAYLMWAVWRLNPPWLSPFSHWLATRVQE